MKSTCFFLLSWIAVAGGATVGLLPGCSDDASSATATDDVTLENVAPDTFLTNLIGDSKCTIVVDGKRHVSEGSQPCPTTLSSVLDRLDVGATSPAFFVVSEHGDQPALTNAYRYVIAGGAGVSSEKLYVASFATGQAAPQSGTEVMAWSERLSAFVFYKEEGGVWIRKGDGTMVPSAAKGARPTFECMSCHTSGGPIMKELHDSWANWTSTWFTVADPRSPDATFSRMFSKVQRADSLERHIIQSQHLHSVGRVARAKEKNALKGVLTQLFCDVGEGSLIAAHSANSMRFGHPIQSFSSMLPQGMVLSPLLQAPRTGGTGIELGLEQSIFRTLNGVSNLSIDASAYVGTLQKFEMKIAGVPGDAIFPMNGPEKSYADIDIAQELIRQNLVDKDFVADVLMTDFTTPAFSASRCALADLLPETWATPSELKSTFATNLATSTLRGAKGLAKRLGNTSDQTEHEKTLNDYANACNLRPKAEFTEDTVRILSQRRAEFLVTYRNLVESDALLPTDNLGSKPSALRFNGKTCLLEPQTETFFGEE